MQEMPAPVAAMSYVIDLISSTWLLLMFGLILRLVVTRKPHSETTQ
jgi:hypothetical protein